MNDNAPESARWVPVRSGAVERFRQALAEARMTLGKTEPHSPARDRARREAEAVVVMAPIDVGDNMSHTHFIGQARGRLLKEKIMPQTTARYIVVGRKLALISDGGSRSMWTRSQIERSSLRIITSKGFAESGFEGLSASAQETLRMNAEGVQLALANGL